MNDGILVAYDGDTREDALALACLLAPVKGVEVVDPGPSPARLVGIVAEEAPSLVVLGSSARAPSGKVFPADAGLELVSAPACPVAVAPAGYALRAPSGLRQLGVAYDGSPGSRAALAMAKRVSLESSGWLELLAVAEPPVLTRSGARGRATESPRRPDLERVVRAALDGIPGEIGAVAEAAYGIPAMTLIRRTAALDLVLIGTRSDGEHGSSLGSVAGGVLTGGASCPVIVVPPVATDASADYPSGGSRFAKM